MKKNLLKRAATVGLMLVAFMTTTASAFTAVTSGNWSSASTWGGTTPGSTVSNQDINIPAGLTVTMDVDVTFSGLLNSFTVNGTLNGSSNMVEVTSGAFAGTGTVAINRLRFSGLFSSMSFTGTATLNHFENMGSVLTIASMMTVSDTLNLDAGSVSIGTGSNLEMMTNSTILVNDGTITIGGGVFNSSNSYSARYIGTSKTTGIEINTANLKNLYVDLDDNTQSVTLGSDLVINETAHVNSGRLNFNAHQLTLNGDLTIATGASLTSNATSDLIIGGSTSMTNGLTFTSGSALNDFTLTNTGTANIKLMSGLNIAGTLRLMHGTLSLESGSTLTMNAGSDIRLESGSIAMNTGNFDGTASYDVEYMGGPGTTAVEATGSGLHDLTLHTTGMNDQMSMNDDVTLSGELNMEYGQLKLSGHKLIVNGTFHQTSSAMLMGSNTSELQFNLTSSANDTMYFNQGAGNNILSRFTLNSGAASTMYLGTDLNIENEMTMTSGMLDIGENDLMMNSAASITNYSASRYIVTSGTGKLHMHVNSSSPYVTFPVGTTTGYSPASVQQSGAGTSGNFMVNTMEGVYSNGTTGFNGAANGASVVNRTWVVSAESGVTLNTNLKFGWEAADEVNSFDRDNAYIAHYNGSSWDTYAFGAATTGATSTYEIERTGLTSLSPFAVVDSSASITLGIDEGSKVAVNISVYPNPTTDQVNVQTANTDDMFMYEVVDMTGKTINAASNKNTLNTFDVSKLSVGFYFIKATNLDTKQVFTKRFVKS